MAKTFAELFAGTGIEPTTDENGGVHYNFNATLKKEPVKPKEKAIENNTSVTTSGTTSGTTATFVSGTTFSFHNFEKIKGTCKCKICGLEKWQHPQISNT